MRQARFIEDLIAYLQNNPNPARDVFTGQGTAPVASVVVVPLFTSEDEPMGALYFTQPSSCDFGNIKDSLLVGSIYGSVIGWNACWLDCLDHPAVMRSPLIYNQPSAPPPASPPTQGFVHCVTLMLEHKLAGQMEVLKAIAAADVGGLGGGKACMRWARWGWLGLGLLMSNAESLNATINAEFTHPDAHIQSNPIANILKPQEQDQIAAVAAAANSVVSSFAPSPRRSLDGSCAPSPRSHLAPTPTPGGPTSHALPTISPRRDTPSPVSAPLSRVGSSSRLFKVSSSKHINTDAMVRALQQEIRKRGRQSVDFSDLLIAEPLGAGGFGQVRFLT
jgi:hypothetical protein